jgi:hypothetical protein
MTEEYRADIAAAVARMGSRTGAGRELADLEKRLHPGERVTALVAGRHGPGNGVLVLTDARVLFVFEGLIREELVDIPLAKVSAVEWRTAVNLGTVTVHAGSEVEVAGVDKDGGEHFVAALKAATT